MVIKNIINNTQLPQEVLNRTLDPGETFTVPYHLWLELANDPAIYTKITNGFVIINDGSTNLSIQDGIDLIRRFQPDSSYDVDNILTNHRGEVIVNHRGNVLVRRSE